MDISILICTYNRAEEIRRTLSKMLGLAVPPELRWEVVVVDNNSTDDTPAEVRGFEGKLPVRYLMETRQGKSNALNKGMEACRAPMILMTDDDVDVSPGWVAAYHEASIRHPDAAFFGGKVMTQFGCEPPQWVLENISWLHSIPRYDRGEEPLTLHDNKLLFIGANMAMRKSVFDAGYRFRPDLGPSGDSRTGRHGGEEGEFQERIMRDGLKGVYVPESVAYHRERPHRLTRRYVWWYFRENGREQQRIEGIAGLENFILGVPRYLWRVFILKLLHYMITRPARSSSVWLRAECNLAGTIGNMLECRALWLSARKKPRS